MIRTSAAQADCQKWTLLGFMVVGSLFSPTMNQKQAGLERCHSSRFKTNLSLNNVRGIRAAYGQPLGLRIAGHGQLAQMQQPGGLLLLLLLLLK